MKITLVYLALYLSHVLCEYSLKVHVAEHHQCIVNVSESTIKEFNDILHKEKKVIYFQIQYDSKQARALGGPIPDDYFANPNEYMWLYDGDNGLPVYMNAPYDFNLLSLFILKEYTANLTVNMNVTNSCNESIVSRVDFLRLVFHQIIKIVSTASLPDKKASAYICYDINNKKKLSRYSFLAYQHLGMNRNILCRYCCKVEQIKGKYNTSNLCPGQKICSSKTLDLQNYIGAFLYAFFPISIWFISRAKLPWKYSKFDYIRSVSNNFDKGEQFLLPFGTEYCWINEHDNPYSIFTFLKWLFLFNESTLFISRIRRSLAVLLSISTLFFDLILQYSIYHGKL